MKNVNPSIIDEMTLKHTFEERDVKLTDHVNGIPVYWVLLDCQHQKIEQRLKSRKLTNIWETSKSLFYFRNRYLEIAAYLGIPVIDTTNLNLDEVVQCVLNIHKNRGMYSEVRELCLKNLTYDTIKERDVENIVYQSGTDGYENVSFYDKKMDSLLNVTELLQFKKKLYARWLCDGEISIDSSILHIKRDHIEELFNTKHATLFHLIDEGESKKIYKLITTNPYLTRYTVIVLKSTIYSHSMQATGEIKDLCKIRATGTQIFLGKI